MNDEKKPQKRMRISEINRKSQKSNGELIEEMNNRKTTLKKSNVGLNTALKGKPGGRSRYLMKRAFIQVRVLNYLRKPKKTKSRLKNALLRLGM